jgi:methionine-S-sulfoxide reductase
VNKGDGHIYLYKNRIINVSVTFITFILLLATTLLTSAKGADMPANTAIATFAGGCFWCMQPFFDNTKGVKKTTVGYTGGHVANPSYEDVSSGETGHAEAIQVEFDPKEVSYAKIVDVFWHQIDPTQVNGQFADEGTQYRTAIFYHSDEQKRIAEESKKVLQASGRYDKPIVTEIVPATTFYPAEEYHQKYYLKSTFQYNMYHDNSGRVQYLDSTWAK